MSVAPTKPSLVGKGAPPAIHHVHFVDVPAEDSDDSQATIEDKMDTEWDGTSVDEDDSSDDDDQIETPERMQHYKMQPVRRSSRHKPIPPISRSQANTDQHYQDIIHVAVARAQQVCRMTSPIIPQGDPVTKNIATKVDRPVQSQCRTGTTTPLSKLNTVPIRPKPSFGAVMPAKPTAVANKAAVPPAGSMPVKLTAAENKAAVPPAQSMPSKTVSNVNTDLRRTNPVRLVDEICFKKPAPVIRKAAIGPPVKPLAAIPLKSPRPFVANASGGPSGWPSPSTVGNLQHPKPAPSVTTTTIKSILSLPSHLQIHRNQWPTLTRPESSERVSINPTHSRQGQVTDNKATPAFWIEDYNRAPRGEPYIPNPHPGILTTCPPSYSPLPYKLAVSGEKYFPGEASLPAFRNHFTPADLRPRPFIARPPPSAPLGNRPLPLFGQPQHAQSREVAFEERVGWSTQSRTGPEVVGFNAK